MATRESQSSSHHAAASSAASRSPKPEARTAGRRLSIFDTLRGFSVLSMVGFHLCYDLEYLLSYSMPWFEGPFQNIWRCSISWTFLFIAGCMCSFSRNNARRAAKYLLVALLIFVVTTLAQVDIPISFGIIFCMGGSTLLAACLQHFGLLPTGPLAAAILLLAFLFCLGVPSGFVGIAQLTWKLPAVLYHLPGLAWLGFPNASFASGDYYPLLPFCLMYLTGAALGTWWYERGYPSWCSSVHLRPLEWVGRHALLIYLIHQPLLLLCTGLL